MLPFELDYSEEKNELLKKIRNVCFEDVKDALEKGGFITVFEHPNKKKYKHQYILVVNINNYVYVRWLSFLWNASFVVVPMGSLTILDFRNAL